MSTRLVSDESRYYVTFVQKFVIFENALRDEGGEWGQNRRPLAFAKTEPRCIPPTGDASSPDQKNRDLDKISRIKRDVASYLWQIAPYTLATNMTLHLVLSGKFCQDLCFSDQATRHRP